jgi:hypothetical protein
MNQNTAKRFSRISSETLMAEGGGGGKVRNWRRVNEAHSTGSFLALIWALYGQPEEIDFEGFSYYFRDTQTSIVFSVYCGASGPAFGGGMNVAGIEQVVNDFEVLLETAVPTDCEVEFETDFGLYRVGARNGAPFEEEVKKS